MSAGGILNETYRVAWIDLCYLRDNIIETLLTSLVGPLLYLLAFGFGIGAHMDDGPGYVAFI
ncbi:MAG: ABC transporter, partial [Candidatus Methanomethylophilaceae archaeon]|nr:ABC transporter [Candidatus Methanomethylophilaceae archaeon]